MNTSIHDRVVLPPGSADELSGCQANSILAASAYKFLHPFQPMTVLLQLLVVHHVAEVLPQVLIHTTILTPAKSARAAAAGQQQECTTPCQCKTAVAAAALEHQGPLCYD